MNAMVDSSESHVYPVVWQTDHLVLIDQRQLPGLYSVVSIHRSEDVLRALQSGIVHGGSALGIAAAYGVYLGAQELPLTSRVAFWERLEATAEQFKAALPHKAELRWAVDRMLNVAKTTEGSVEEVRKSLLLAAQALQKEDLRITQAIGQHGLTVLPATPEKLTLYTHCNHGALATSGYGTSLGIVRAAWQAGRITGVYAGETRPGFQGSRLTAWECVRESIPVTVVTDSMAAHCLQQGLIHAILVGADRIASNGDTVNKVGTYGLALAAQAHGVPFLVAASLSTVDFSVATGKDIEIREAPAEDIYQVGNRMLCPEGVRYYNPASDMTPASLITAIVTEKGAISPSELHTLALNSANPSGDHSGESAGVEAESDPA